MACLKLEIYQVRNGIWRKPFTSDVTETQMSEVRNYFAQNGMGLEEREGVFRVESPFLSVAVKVLAREHQIKFVEGKARMV